MAIPKERLDKVLKNAFMKTHKMGALFKPCEDIYKNNDWRSRPVFWKSKLYTMADVAASYNYEGYCKMCWEHKASADLLHFHVDFFDGELLKVINYSIYCGIPRTTNEFVMEQKIMNRLGTARFEFKLIEE